MFIKVLRLIKYIVLKIFVLRELERLDLGSLA